jgi:hypothetical protein
MERQDTRILSFPMKQYSCYDPLSWVAPVGVTPSRPRIGRRGGSLRLVACTFPITYHLSLLMVFPHTIFLSQNSVEDFAIARSRHLFVFNEYNVFRNLEAGYFALTIT